MRPPGRCGPCTPPRARPAHTSQRLPAALRLLVARRAQVGVVPAAEAVLQVPGALAMPDQDQFVGSHGDGQKMRQGLKIAEILFAARPPGRACALALARPAPAHFLPEIFPLARQTSARPVCACASGKFCGLLREGCSAPRRQCACVVRSGTRVLPGSHGAHVSREGGGSRQRACGPGRRPATLCFLFRDDHLSFEQFFSPAPSLCSSMIHPFSLLM